MSKRPPSDQLVTSKEIREHLGVVDRTLTRWFDAGLPCKRGAGGKNPRVKLWDLVKFLHERESEEAVQAAETRNLLARAKLEAIERENAVRRGKLLQADDVRRQYLTIAHALRAMLEPIARAHPDVEKELVTAMGGAAKRLEEGDA